MEPKTTNPTDLEESGSRTIHRIHEMQMAKKEIMSGWLQSEKLRVNDLIMTMVEPTGKQARNLLYWYAAIIQELFPFPPIDMMNYCIYVFWKCNWDIMKRQPTPGSQPPSGKMIYVLLCDLSALFCSKRFQAIVDPAPESPQEEDSKHATIVSKSDPAKRQSTSESSSGASMTMFMNSAGEITMPNGDVFVKKKGSSL